MDNILPHIPIITLDFISENQESDIVYMIEKDHRDIEFGKENGLRSGIYRYGERSKHPDRLVSEIIPIYLKFDIGHPYNSVTINEYDQGDIIDWHIDKPKLGEIITILSLLSDSTLQFREKKNKSNVVNYILPRRSLFNLSGNLRYNFEHYLKAENKRYSIIYRNIQ